MFKRSLLLFFSFPIALIVLKISAISGSKVIMGLVAIPYGLWCIISCLKIYLDNCRVLAVYLGIFDNISDVKRAKINLKEAIAEDKRLTIAMEKHLSTFKE